MSKTFIVSPFTKRVLDSIPYAVDGEVIVDLTSPDDKIIVFDSADLAFADELRQQMEAAE